MSFNLSEYVNLPEQEAEQPEEQSVPDPTLSLWDAYPTLWKDPTPYVDPFEDSRLLQDTTHEEFRLSMLAQKKKLDSLFHSLSPKSYPSIRVNTVLLELEIVNQQAVFDLLQVYLAL